MLKFGASLFANRRNNKTYLTDTYGLVNPVYYSRKANPYYQPFDANGNYVYDFDVQNTSDTDLGFNIFEERKIHRTKRRLMRFHLFSMLN